MKKKEYIKPTIKAHKMKTRHQLLAGSVAGENVYNNNANEEYETY